MATKQDLINRLAENASLTKRASAEVTDAFLKSIKELAVEDGKLQIVGWGSFVIRERLPRVGRNPHTGETIEIPASKTIALKAGKELKEALK